MEVFKHLNASTGWPIQKELDATGYAKQVL